MVPAGAFGLAQTLKVCASQTEIDIRTGWIARKPKNEGWSHDVDENKKHDYFHFRDSFAFEGLRWRAVTTAKGELLELKAPNTAAPGALRSRRSHRNGFGWWLGREQNDHALFYSQPETLTGKGGCYERKSDVEADGIKSEALEAGWSDARPGKPGSSAKTAQRQSAVQKGRNQVTGRARGWRGCLAIS